MTSAQLKTALQAARKRLETKAAPVIAPAPASSAAAAPPVRQQPFKPNRRRLIEAMGLAYDPFSSSVGESDVPANFETVYVEPRESLLDALKQPQHSFVFADYGMGKTATRLALEYLVRSTPGSPLILTVPYTPRLNDLLAPFKRGSLERHLSAIGRTLAIDLVVHVLERFNDSLPDYSELQLEALRRQVGVLPRRFRELLQRLPREELKAPPWCRLRPVVRHVTATSTWKDLIARIALPPNSQAPRTPSWEQAISDAHLLGFDLVYVLVDALDEGAQDPKDLASRVLDLPFALIHAFDTYSVYLKNFLPLSLTESFNRMPQRALQGLTLVDEPATIDYVSAEHLQAIIRERLLAASTSNSSFRTLDLFRDDDLKDSIEARLAILAQGSPRRMLQLASLLLDFHARYGFRDQDRLVITAQEWETYQNEAKNLGLASR
jgi:hypothetical protein